MQRGLLALIGTLLLSAGVAPAEPGEMPVRGVTLAHLHRGEVGYGSDAARRQLDEIARLGGNWVALTDFAYMPDVRRPELRWGGDRSLTDAGLARTARDARERGIKVLFKPHIWSRQFWDGGEWHGTIEMQNEADWRGFFQRYGDYIVEQAKLAEAVGAEALCVGVEMKAANHREADWRNLIKRVREVYNGTLTYSANSDEWRDVAWWDALDCVGITAYFPLTAEGVEPTEPLVRAAWRGILAEIRPFAEDLDMPVCFTELGFSRSSRAGNAPWEHHEIDPDPARQAMLYRVSLDEIARGGVVEGVFLWKWFTGDADVAARMERNDVFGLQNRPQALAAIRGAWAGDGD